MNDFFILYEKIKQNPTNKNIENEYIDKGMEIYNATCDISIKESVLTKLIEIFPNEPAFYYYMGYSFKKINLQKSFPFFQKSYEINPYNIENLIDYCDLLNTFGNPKKVIDLNKTIPFGDYLKDIRLLTVFVNCSYKEYYFKDLLKNILYIIKEKSKIPATTDHEKEWKFSNYLNAGHMLSYLGDHEKSMIYSEKAFEISNKFNLKNKLKLSGISNLLALEDYIYHDLNTHYNKALQINDLYPNQILYKFTPFHISNEKSSNNAHKKIRIGYVSGDFLNHAVSNFILPILKNHDREHFDIFIFYNQKNIWEKYLDLKLHQLHQHCIFNLSTQESADLVHSFEIDILFDLNGYTESGRLDMFSLNPSPIQISYLGYPNTTGLKSIRYRITDSVADNSNSLQKYSETLIRMPKCFLLYDSINQVVPIIPRKTKDIIILGSLNNEKKNSKQLLETWKTILEVCPNTKLLIKLVAYDDLIERQSYYMKKLNVSKDRLIMITKVDNDGYNKLFSMVDIVLDTFPYSGTTTTCNALYNSIPVVTLYNKDYHAHNVSSSLLKNAGLDELVCDDINQYINVVKHLTCNPLQIDEYKKTVGEKFKKSMNVHEFMESYENILKDLYNNMKNSVLNDDVIEICI
jgi:predicted O-linked N-acetylglucosamine transferase (SPINDLY family)